MQKIKKFTAIALCAGLVGCGDTTGEQALYGAGAGYLGSYLVNGSPLLGAAAGAAANVLYCRQGPGNCD
ncbi:MAG: hypothetical protein L3J36_04210 [Rhodobacteraceae bacterium]|nr:hypothetical protein [Paracoccaceae bacterium]